MNTFGTNSVCAMQKSLRFQTEGLLNNGVLVGQLYFICIFSDYLGKYQLDSGVSGGSGNVQQIPKHLILLYPSCLLCL